MVRGSSGLLCLVYQHLLQNGYAKSARELQIESGEKFFVPKVTLKQVFKDWKGSKSGKASNGRHGTRGPDRGSSCEESGATENDLEARGKRRSSEIVARVTRSTTSSAKKSASKGKGKMETASPNEWPVTTETPTLADISEEETLPLKAAPLKGPMSASNAAADLKSKTMTATDSDTIKQDKRARAKRRLPASNGKSAVRKYESSESSDETDIEKKTVRTPAAPPVSAAKSKAARARATKGKPASKATDVTPASKDGPAVGKTPAEKAVEDSSEEDSDDDKAAVVTPTPSGVKASKDTKQTPSIVARPEADTKESSESESEEERQNQTVRTPAAPPVSAAKSKAARARATKGKPASKATDVIPASKDGPAVGKTPAEKAVDDSSEEDSDDDKTVRTPAAPPVSAAKSTAARARATKGKPASKATDVTPASKGGPAVGKTPAEKTVDDSSEEDSDDDKAAVVTPTPSGVKASKDTKQTPSIVARPEADTSESSESESEEERQNQTVRTPAAPPVSAAKSKAARARAIKGKPASKASDVTPASKGGPAVGKTPAEKAVDDSSEEDSDDDKAAVVTPTPSGVKASKDTKQTPSIVARPEADTSESSESESEEEPQKQTVRTPAAPPVSAAKSKAARAEATKGKPASKATDVTPASKGGPAVGKTPAEKAVDDSSEEDSDDDKAAVVTPTPSGVKASKDTKQTPSIVARPEADTSESSESESEEEPQKQTVRTPAAPPVSAAKSKAVRARATKGKPASKATDVTPASKGGPAVGKTPAEKAVDDSSEEDSDDDKIPTTPRLPTSKPKENSQPAASQAKADDTSSSSETESEELPVKQNHKTAMSPRKGAKTANAQVSKPSTVIPAGAEGSETSDDSDSEPDVKAPENQKTAMSPRKGAKTANAQVSKPSAVIPAGAEGSETSDDSDSEPEVKAPEKISSPLPASSVKTPSAGAKQAVTAQTTPGMTGNLPKAALADDSSDTDSSDSDEDRGVKVKAASVTPDVRTPAPGAKQPSATSLAAAARPVEDSSGTDSSDNDEEPQSKTTGGRLQTSTIKTPSTGATTGRIGTPLKASAPAADSSESSDSDEEPALTNQKTAMSPRKGAKTANAQVSKPSTVIPAGAEGSETSDDSDSEPEVKAPEKISSPLPATSVKTPSAGAKQAVTAQTTPGMTRNLPKAGLADDSSDTDSSDSDEDLGVKKTASPLRASGVKTPSTGARHPVTVAANAAYGKTKTPLPAADSSETEDSDTYEPLSKATPASKGKPTSKSTALTPASHDRGAAVRTSTQNVVDETSEASDSDADDEPSSVKAPPPITGASPRKPPAATTAFAPDSDADSESSDDSDSKENVTWTPQIPSASFNKTAAALIPSKKTPVTSKETVIQAIAIKAVESESSDDELPSAQALFSSLTPKTRATKLSLQPVTKSEPVSPAKPGTTPKPAAAAAEEESSDSSDSADGKQEPAVSQKTALVKLKRSTPASLLTSTPSIASPAKGKARLPAETGKKEVSATESNVEETDQDGTPASTPKAVARKAAAKAPKTSKVEAVRSPGEGKAAALKQEAAKESSGSSSLDEKTPLTKSPFRKIKRESLFAKHIVTKARTKARGNSEQPKDPSASSSESSGSEEKPVAKAMKGATLATPKVLQKKLVKSLGSPKVTSPTKTPAGWKPPAAESSSESSDSEDDVPQQYVKASPKRKVQTEETKGKALDGLSKVAAPGEDYDSAGDSSVGEPEESQNLQPPTKQSTVKRKLNLDKERVAKPSTKKSKVKLQPETVPAPSTPRELGQSSETKKSGKKRKSSSEDGESKHKAKKAKKEKKKEKKKKLKASSGMEEDTSPKTSKKEKKKLEKDKKKKKDQKEKKLSKKLVQSPTTPVVESTDSGVSFRSKPKKKKKVKTDKTTD